MRKYAKHGTEKIELSMVLNEPLFQHLQVGLLLVFLLAPLLVLAVHSSGRVNGWIFVKHAITDTYGTSCRLTRRRGLEDEEQEKEEDESIQG